MKQMIPKLIPMAMAMALAACATGGGNGGSASTAPGSATKVHRLSIGRVASVPLSNAEADAILAGATRVLRNRDSGSDVSADVTLQQGRHAGHPRPGGHQFRRGPRASARPACKSRSSRPSAIARR